MKSKEPIHNAILDTLENHGVDFSCFVNISSLSHKQNRGFPHAILIGQVLSPEFIRKVINTPDYVKEMKRRNCMETDEFYLKERKTDRMADSIAMFIRNKGYDAYSQSEDNITASGDYDQENKSTPLPHKIIAGLAGLGWMGKHNLLVNPEFGSAFSMCTVLTNAPLETANNDLIESKCGDCDICKKVCPENIIKGKQWDMTTSREDLIDVHQCKTCLMCMVFCPFSQRYMERELKYSV